MKITGHRRWEMLLLSAALLLSLASCGQDRGTSSRETASPEPSLAEVDLSEYDEHGDWHCGRMWVHKTDGGYDHKEGYYAYIDESGALITDWHSDQEWIVPFDFDQDVALVYTGRDRAIAAGVERSQTSQPVSYDLIDLDGNLLNFFVASAYTTRVYLEDRDNWANGGFHRGQGNHPTPHAFNQYGLLFFNLVHDDPLGYGNHTCGVLFTDGTLLEFTHEYPVEGLRSYYQRSMDLSGFGEQYVNGYLSYHDSVSYTSKEHYNIYLFFDMDGKVAADLTQFPYTIRSVSDVSTDKTIEVIFYGVDENLYRVTVDMDGTWLDEPVRTDS